ncbi:unnamed protein product [Gordionus sp. m RMFG-2023]|uniref:NADP-dependent malic enzyme-like n=1 Tax=Gordionus sp. m RMFG-2023 TaxID=3053472 RepID=UPI0030E4D1D5
MPIPGYLDNPSQIKRGIELLRDPVYNKGRAFTLKERQLLGIHGLLPPRITSPDMQVKHILENFNRWDNDLDKFIFLIGLQDRNEKLFYRILCEYTEIMMPIVYTPTVGLACQKYGNIFRRPRGLFISINDKGHVYSLVCNWPETNVKVVVVTDGERILGLGDLGSCGMGIPVGKLSLYTALGSVDPKYCLPVAIDVGTDNQELQKDSAYLGLQKKRVRGQAYDELIDEFMHAIIRRYGPHCLIQFEDFANSNAFRFLEKYRHQFCTFNDDIQGTASVIVAGLYAAVKITKKPLKENKILFLGAGEASIGIASLLTMSMVKSGISEEEAISKIWLVDSRGLIIKERDNGKYDSNHKWRFAKDHPPMTDLLEIVRAVKPNILIGAAGVGNTFTPQIIQSMSELNERPIIFALSNPTSQSECTAQSAYENSKGKCVFASGSPYPPVNYNGKIYNPGQGNNAYIFPGVGMGIIASGLRTVNDEVFLVAAKALADEVKDMHLQEGKVYPPLSEIRNVSLVIASKVVEYAFNMRKLNSKSFQCHSKLGDNENINGNKNDISNNYGDICCGTSSICNIDEPTDKLAYVKSLAYDYSYESYIPDMYDWPDDKE